MSPILLSDRIPNDFRVKDLVYAIETRQGSHLFPQDGKEFPGMHFSVAAYYLFHMAEDYFPKLFEYIAPHELFREVLNAFRIAVQKTFKIWTLIQIL